MGHAIVKRILVVAASMLVLPFVAQTAHADSYVDFSCAGSSCSGAVTQTGSNYSTTGIAGLVQTVSGAPDYGTGTFDLIFDTSADTISLNGDAGAGGDTLLGSIVGVSPDAPGSQTPLALTVDWTSLPTDFQTYLGASAGNSVGSVIYLNTSGAATSIDFTVTPTATPEPASFLLLGAGLLALCGLRCRKAFDAV